MAEEVKEVAAPAPDSPEYAEAMAAKVDANTAAAEQAAAGDKVIEEKPEAAPEAAPAPAKEEAPEEKPEGESEEAAKEALAAKGLDYSAFQEEFDATGELTEESFKKLEDAGIPRELVESHIEGQKALASLLVAQGVEAAGGEEQFNAMAVWAKNTLNQAELEAYNKAVVGTPEEMLQAVRGLRNRYEAEYGRQPRLLGGNGASTGSAGYASRAEMTADMRDKRYSTDPAFREKVTKKIAATTAF